MEILRVEPTPSPNTMKIVLTEKDKIINRILIQQLMISNHNLLMIY